MTIANLNQIRAKPERKLSATGVLLQAVLSVCLGAALGLLAKYLDGVPDLGMIGTSLGVWILAATVLAAWSRSPEVAALRVFLFFAALLSAYYWYSMLLFGAFPAHYFFAWGAVALLSPVGGYIVWYARGDGWIAAVCAALPVAFLLAEGTPFFYSRWVPQGFDLAAAVALAFLLGNKGSQRVKILALAAIACLGIRRTHMISFLFGWM